MTGAIINALGIVVGGVFALLARRPLPAKFQNILRTCVGAALVWYGLKLTWLNINGSPGQMFKQVLTVLLAMTLGRLLGRVLHLQAQSNRVGQHATRVLASPPAKPPFNLGFILGTALFCVGPLALLGSVQEGLDGGVSTLVVKALIDGLTVMSFVPIFGWSAIASALPVLALEGVLIRATAIAAASLRHSPYPLLDSIAATDGLLILSVALIILDVRKIAVADYLPSLALAPILTWAFK